MEIRYIPLQALRTYGSGVHWHEANVRAWSEVYRTMGMVRPLVVNSTNGHILNPPGELEALLNLQTEGIQPDGILRDWRVPVWLIPLTEKDEPRWALVLAGGVDRTLITRPYDNSLVDVLLNEAELAPDRI